MSVLNFKMTINALNVFFFLFGMIFSQSLVADIKEKTLNWATVLSGLIAALITSGLGVLMLILIGKYLK